MGDAIIYKDAVLLIVVLRGQHGNTMHDMMQFLVHRMIVMVQYTYEMVQVQ